jgi:hypothetical protein
MRRLTAAQDRIRQARDLPSVLDVACDAFEEILAVIGDYEDTHDTLVTPLLLAATQAANGRDAVLFAPSLPPRALHCPPAAQAGEQASSHDIGPAVAGLSRLLAAQLASTGAAVASGADRTACHEAASHAGRIHDLLAGAGP